MPDRTPTSGESADSADELVSAVLTASRVLVAVSARSLAQVEDRLTLTQFRALVVLSGGAGRTNLNGLADQLAVTPSTALRTVDRLVAGGLATRRENADNRREVLLGLTDEGERTVREVTGVRRQEISSILDRMPVRSRSALVAAFRAFATAAGEPDAEPHPVTW
ncbi:MAG: MarR family winged helix-turn-helix transcriptional regulator [Nocardioides sp.]